MIDNLTEAIAHAREVAKDKRELAKTICPWADDGEETLNECIDCAINYEHLAAWLTELLERREADKWIPVSERLPEEYGSYLVMWRSLTEGFPDRLFYEICEYEPEEDEWERIEQSGEAGAEIVAWQPLPEPYKENEK